ncbi:lactose/L-arabinose transport system permease protein [Clostridium saccharoperbutylacetonicum]|uniref:Lactose transport system permease protein LacF n=1 Tax=Clostridium saccharoperbutylacetonicum N1-4(HMT) TaxID=931276 RepID=M1MDZ1_9CLOT|nr:sugar ABC transporter permease [Clostridium saccharoperbutylacetonicum]AGF54603.1 lactose transport system permease protein LacF [Clostridium saccharoperbutylacetonicum N1-4(HMT)]NRT58876.1 lactose/L-arabinose transport system permease protein [Clostridium saccharoperbutylacetonicum]NSB28065.1 lactose/L-arabinose transport system permease protein [Clostridium saccharoperbutylacetonicum]NSB41551.1 lactose/L-arabinose transport system permease protein [Clostridium saccharoperbutylacetonicum]
MKRNNHAGLNSKENMWGWIFISGGTFLIGLLVFYPMVQSLIMSLQSGKGNNLKFSGLDNYVRMFSDATLIKAVGNTFIYLIVQVPIMIILALIISSVLNDRTLKFSGFFRTAIFLPCVASLVGYSIIIKSIFASDGLVNKMLMSLHLIGAPIEWVTHPIWAKVLIIIAITWRWTGYNMIFYLSGLQNIDYSIYEAADIDGASPFKKFTAITIPLLKPIILFTTITSTIGTLQLFDEIMNITKGGPANATTTISKYIYDLCFTYTPDFGYATAVAYLIVVMVIILAIIQFKIGGDKND